MRLLALRKSGESFSSVFNVKSDCFVELFQKQSRLQEKITSLQNELAELLHHAFRQNYDQKEHRRYILKIKRDIHNLRPVKHMDASFLGHDCLDQLGTYSRLVEEKSEVLSQLNTAPLEEIRNNIGTLLRNEKFLSAIDYSNPELFAKLKKYQTGSSKKHFSKLERSVYSYGLRFFSKANPLYVFSELWFAEELGIEIEQSCELSLHMNYILGIEEHLLSYAGVQEKDLLYCQNSLKREEKITFIIPDARAKRYLSISSNPLLDKILFFFHRQLPKEKSIGRLTEYLHSEFPNEDVEGLQNYVAALIKNKILVRYLVRDFSKFYVDLEQQLLSMEKQLKDYQEIHHGHFDYSQLSQKTNDDQILDSQLRHKAPANYRSFYVDSYFKTSARGPNEKSFTETLQDLKQVKPLFLPNGNNRYMADNIVLLLKDILADKSCNSIPFLDFLDHCIQNSVNFSSLPPAQNSARESFEQQSALLQKKLATLQGELEKPILEQLTQKYDAPKINPHLCFNGPFDYQNQRYYINNIWAGNGRFISRYLINQPGKRARKHANSSAGLNVQVYDFFDNSNKGYTVTPFDVGFGMNARFKHLFKEWLTPEEIQLSLDGDQVIYSKAGSGQRIHFYYLGFALISGLATEYQILLANKNDFYLNSFADWIIPHADANPFQPGLTYGQICLRRDRWYIPGKEIPALIPADNTVSCAMRLLSWAERTLDNSCRYYYFRTAGNATRFAHKPMFLDVQNPLSVSNFYTRIAQNDPNSFVCFERMEPPINNLYEYEKQKYLTEVMLEV
ncbi:MAG: lantibiotic dehydratase [Calditrichia bacterium]